MNQPDMLNSEKNSAQTSRLWNQQKPAAQLNNQHQYQLPTANNNANTASATIRYSHLLILQIIHAHTFIHIIDGSATTSQLQSRGSVLQQASHYIK